ncbi:GT2 family glycosyltransferase [Bacteroides zoogleoformans]|uniref:Glycosyltransferase family 2 protein n=1 Tax=Bacteroides zoogleoformans TaxID=28119 RepID=A0ABM6T852_9BACE|nr:glycosyltransferase family 2 protein [Bacteroides zoogleoformans]AVM52855.1 glycosyltransferase family 2 protein [Bacteroides zoogleoformans]TWJ18620.1 GT2 family glycosyltransferase [Bacteroides zoogleoformans]
MKILTIIAAYNFERWLDRCLGSLRQSSLQADVVVIDNASQDRTVQLIESRYPEVRLIQSQENLGFGRANNLGMRMALEEGYEAVFLLNQDAWIDAETLGTLSALSGKYPQYGILSPTHLTGAGDKLEKGFAGYAGLSPSAELKTYRAKDKSLCPPIEVPFVNAAFWFIPVSVLKQVGGFCPLFRHYGEDVDYVNRLHRCGYRIGYSPYVQGCHDREYRPVARKAFLYSEEVYLLSEYANVQYSFPKAFAYGVAAGIKKTFKALLQGNLKDAVAYLRITASVFGRTGKVIGYRKLNKRCGTWYI